MKSFYTVSLSQILLRSPHKNYLGFIRAYYKKKFEKLFILPKEKALASVDGTYSWLVKEDLVLNSVPALLTTSISPILGYSFI